MAKVKILKKTISEQELKEMFALLEGAGCDAGDIEVIESVGAPDSESEDEVVVVLGSSANCDDPALEEELAKVQNGGRRAICIWPKTGAAPELPEGAKKYAYSVVPWDAKKLSAVLADDDVTCFENDAGEPLPAVPMDRNLCVDEPKKPK